MKPSIKQISSIGLFTAFMVIFAQIAIPIPFSPVPLTLSIFGVFLTAVILGSKCSTFVQVIYVLLGICGIPVFANFSGGLGIVAGPKGGYILSYPIIALVIGLLVERKKTVSAVNLASIMSLGLVICYSLGAAWLGISLKLSPLKAISIGVLPFIPMDIIKVIIAAIVGYQVRRILAKANLLQAFQK